MRLTYIYHSGFVIEIDNVCIVVDYFNDKSDNNLIGTFMLDYLKTSKKKLYVLSTHSHYDHFDKEILTWRLFRNDIIYIFSKEILESGFSTPEDAIYLAKGDFFEDSEIKIRAYGSTDIGGSFLIEVAGKSMFHAGDLNNWHWNEESIAKEIKEAEDQFERELEILYQNIKHIHLVMFPVDPRLGKDYMKGAKEFVYKIKTDIFVPMHFDDAYDKIEAFEAIANRVSTNYICWKNKLETINLE